jgi:hypothetical protein
MKTLSMLLAASALFTELGCSAITRSPERYRDDTQKLLDEKSGDIKACYDGVLKTDQKAGGKVSVKFAFDKDTGKLIDAKLDPANTTAPEPVGRCVLSSLSGIAITPLDTHRGEATWSWDFNPDQSAK